MTKGKQKLSMVVLPTSDPRYTFMNMELRVSQLEGTQRSLFHLILSQLDFDLKNMTNNRKV